MVQDIIITSLIHGSTYALLAIGFSLIFGVARIVNIAHTAFYMVASYCIYFVTHKLGYHPVLGMLVAVPLVTLLGLISYKLFIDPIREHEGAVLIGTIALAIALQEFMLLIFTGDYLSVPGLIEGYLSIFGVKVFYQQLITVVAALIVLGALRLLLMNTKLGLAIRSTAGDREVANLMGMNESRVAMATVGISIALAGGGGSGWFGQHKGKFFWCLYIGIGRSAGSFPDPYGCFSKGFGCAFDHDPGADNQAGRLVWGCL
ncbi:MAG: branched-chain amino acid ABC transporter permease [Planctomycetota bacterium]|jgi:branched-chain amino acid transport system permease protein